MVAVVLVVVKAEVADGDGAAVLEMEVVLNGQFARGGAVCEPQSCAHPCFVSVTCGGSCCCSARHRGAPLQLVQQQLH